MLAKNYFKLYTFWLTSEPYNSPSSHWTLLVRRVTSFLRDVTTSFILAVSFLTNVRTILRMKMAWFDFQCRCWQYWILNPPCSHVDMAWLEQYWMYIHTIVIALAFIICSCALQSGSCLTIAMASAFLICSCALKSGSLEHLLAKALAFCHRPCYLVGYFRDYC